MQTKTDSSSDSAPNYKPRARALSESRVEQLRHIVSGWSALPGASMLEMLFAQRDKAIALLLISTGMTLEEIGTLNTDDVRHDASEKAHIIVCHRSRAIPLDADTAKAINRWLSLRPYIQGRTTCKPLFVTRKLERIARTTVVSIVDRLKADSAIEFDTFALRHAFIRRMVTQGYLHDQISDMLGRPSRQIIQMYVMANELMGSALER